MSKEARSLNAKVNLIPYNTVDVLDWERPSENTQQDFLNVLTSNGIQSTLRKEKGHDIEAACGGCCACATCHVYVDEKWISKLNSIDDDEESMLDQAFDVKKNSRLSCQILLNEELDGIELELAPE